jgi:hypothetical protein
VSSTLRTAVVVCGKYQFLALKNPENDPFREVLESTLARGINLGVCNFPLLTVVFLPVSIQFIPVLQYAARPPKGVRVDLAWSWEAVGSG